MSVAEPAIKRRELLAPFFATYCNAAPVTGEGQVNAAFNIISTVMARPLRLQFPGAVYHVTGRGNARQKVFFTDADRELFLRTL